MAHRLSPEQEFCLQGCRSYKQYVGMRRGFERGDCIFCGELNEEINRVLWEDERVRAWHVHESFLRDTLRVHILIVPIRHVRFTTDLTDEEVLSVHHAKKELVKRFGYQGGLDHVREGDMRFNAGTVPHLHYNIFEPNQTEEERAPIFKNPSDREENMRRASNYSGHFESGVEVEHFEVMLSQGLVDKKGEWLVEDRDSCSVFTNPSQHT